ncbi:GSCOCT00009840001.2-RA-CDS [Cotesia congregata]|uniref:Venom protein 13_2 n=1 Tax=Cotesia congregata TaxID=51543 RepID=A0A8J2EAC1_COTCN|nr:GSCOCT00009840001.2-RA-CDS [Cotesia congregata]CAG5075147.1 Putative venom protein 13_2 [Cotesia congregata]
MTSHFIKKLLISIVITFYLISAVKACWLKCPDYVGHYKKNVPRKRIISHLSDSLKLRQLALIGTRHSASQGANFETQKLTISQQLNYGVRVLDSAIWSSSNIFWLYGWKSYFMPFDKFLREVNFFLTAHPREFVIILMREEWKPASDVTKSYCEIVQYYRDLADGHRIVTKWTLEDTIGQHRGKILLAGSDSAFNKCDFDVTNNCQLQRTSISTDSTSDVEDKWIDAQNFHDRIYRKNSGSCFVNFLADFADSNTWKLAVRGYYTKRNPDCEAPINVRMASYFSTPHRALVIVMADYVTQELIDSILSTNFKGDSFYTSYTDDSE